MKQTHKQTQLHKQTIAELFKPYQFLQPPAICF